MAGNLESFAEYLGLAPVFMRRVGFVFFKDFLLVLAKYSFWRGHLALGYWAVVLWDIGTFLRFPNFLGFKVLSRSATCETTRMYHVYK